MIRQMIHRGQWLAAVLALLFMTVGCVDDTYQSCNQGVIDENGMVTLTIRADVPGLKVTRSVDINGEQIATLWVLAFNKDGYMISRVLATDLTHSDPGTGNNGGAGTFTAKVPGSTCVLHFLANVNMDNFSDQDNIGRHENEVIAPLVSSSGNLVYWGRKEFASEQALKDFATNPTGVVLYRNQALLKYEVQPAQGVRSLEVDGWAICNQYAYGTVAPFDASAVGAADDTPFHFDLVNHDFVTTLPEAFNVRMGDDEDVAQATASAGGDPRYVFDNPNAEDDQLYMIMKIRKNGGMAKYYKVLLIDEKKEPYKVIRNHLYTVTVKDVNESYGVETFAEAKNATPVNNPWITISDEIPEVSNGDVTLRIEGQTTVISQAAGDKVIEFSYTGTSKPAVSWTSNDGVSDSAPEVEWDSETGKGTITLHMNAPVPGRITYGTLQIKESDGGPLSRRVKVLSTEPFEFTPVWVSSEIPLLNNENIAVLFYIPDDFPQELLPIDVKFGCDLIDAQIGTNLKVITEKNEYTVPYYNSETGEWETEEVSRDWNYKYVYSAETTGRHRVEFRTILTNLGNNVDSDEEFHIYMEGDDATSGEDLFRQRDLFFAFQPSGIARRIMLNDGDASKSYAAQDISNLNPVSGETITIPFTLGTLQGNSITPQRTVDSEIWVYYDSELVKPSWTNEIPQTDYFGNTYVVYNTTKAENEVEFTTVSPNFDHSEIVFSAKSTEGYGDYTENPSEHSLGVNDRNNSFRSAAVTIRSTGRLKFTPEWSLDGSMFTDAAQPFEVAYGEGQNVYLRVNIPQEVIGKTFEINLATKYLTPVDGEWTKWPSAQGDGYTFTVTPTGNTEVFHFQTNRLVSAETLTLSAGNTVGFDPVTMVIANAHLKGTIQLPEGVSFKIDDPYIVLERVSDGARIGTFTLPNTGLVGQESTTYTLALRGEYNLSESDRVTVKWSPVKGDQQENTYVHTCTLHELMQGDVVISLVEQQ